MKLAVAIAAHNEEGCIDTRFARSGHADFSDAWRVNRSLN